MQADGPVFLGDHGAEVFHKLRVTGGGNADLAFVARELGEILGAADMGPGAGAMARVGGEHDRDAEAGGFGDFLHAVGPFGEFARGAGPVVQDVAEVLLLDVGFGGGGAPHLADGHGIGILPARSDRPGIAFFLGFGEQGLLFIGEVVFDHAAFRDGDVGMEHQAGLLFQGHLGDEVRDTVFHRQAPVFIGVDPAVLVEVLELVFPFGQDRCLPGTQFRLLQFGAAGRQQQEGQGGEQKSFHMLVFVCFK